MLNKTPREDAKKTKSAHRTWLLAVILILLTGFVGFYLLIDRPKLSYVEQENKSCAGLELRQHCFNVERADTNEKRLKGLSDRDNLPQDQAMLFLFDTPMEQCMWMKDMRFVVDMIWLNENKEVIKIEPNVAPETYPKSFCAENTKYVIEINADLANSLRLAIGDKIEL